MSDHAQSKLRCREGDVALIIKEEPGCECNIGRAVTVQGPIIVQPEYGPTWLIEPVESDPWTIRMAWGDLRTGPVTFESFIEHPDAWLLPLRPRDELDWLVQEEIGQRIITLEKGKLVDLTTFLKAVEFEDVVEAGFPFDLHSTRWIEIRSLWNRVTEGGTNIFRAFNGQGIKNVVEEHQPPSRIPARLKVPENPVLPQERPAKPGESGADPMQPAIDASETWLRNRARR